MEVTNSDDIIDIRDVIVRVEELRDQDELDEDEQAESDSLNELLEELRGLGGDEQWEGDWYPLILIRDSSFRDYAKQLADDIGAIGRNATWPLDCIDWEKAADELRVDYSAVDFGGVEYLYR